MFWLILALLIVLALASLISFKYGEVHKLHKTKAEFEHYLDAHPLLNNDVIIGIQIAENIVDDLIENN